MTDAIVWPPEWPRYLDDRLGAPQPGEYRQTPDDFLVEEDLGFAPEGQGEHLWLWIAKRDATTSRVASSLAHLCGVTRRDVGYAGMKDRVAVTRQWFSVHLPGKEAPADPGSAPGRRGLPGGSARPSPAQAQAWRASRQPVSTEGDGAGGARYTAGGAL